jgi:hypothetical protein
MNLLFSLFVLGRPGKDFKAELDEQGIQIKLCNSYGFNCILFVHTFYNETL